MPISVTCPGCGKRLKAKDSLAGRMVPCPACGTKLVIGSPEDIAAALLRDDAGPPAGEPEAPAPPEDHAPPERPAEPPRRPRPKPVVRRKPGPAAAASSLPPLTANEPPFWLRHLHWLLVLALIPLAVSLLEASQEEDFLERLSDTLQQAPEESRARVRQVLAQMEEEGGSLDKIFAALPDHKLQGAWLPRDSWNHWAFTGGAALLFFLFLLALCAEGSARPQHLLAVGLFTATIGLLFLFLVQALAEWSQGMIIIPRGVIGILLLVVQLIGWSYRAANDPSCGFLLSLVGYTLGVGLCEEVVKALPVIFLHHRPSNLTWRGAYLWGLASGAGFGLAEGVIYAGGYYNGISGVGIYFVRNISCVALHALWTGSAAIMIHRKQRWFQEELAWHDWLVRVIAVVAVPMVLHGLYDTLLQQDMNALALGVAVLSFGYLAYQISRLRGADDQAANEEMLREYQRRRGLLGAR